MLLPCTVQKCRAHPFVLHHGTCRLLFVFPPSPLHFVSSSLSHFPHAAAAAASVPFSDGAGIGIGPPGEVSCRAVRISTPVSVTSSVCSSKFMSAQQESAEHISEVRRERGEGGGEER